MPATLKENVPGQASQSRARGPPCKPGLKQQHAAVVGLLSPAAPPVVYLLDACTTVCRTAFEDIVVYCDTLSDPLESSSGPPTQRRHLRWVLADHFQQGFRVAYSTCTVTTSNLRFVMLVVLA